MYKNIERLKFSKGPKHFNFIPKTFTIPNEHSEFAAAHHRTRGKNTNSFRICDGALFVVKNRDLDGFMS